jgi:hypothetical protein
MKRGFTKQGFGKHRPVILLLLASGFTWAWIGSAAATDVYTWTDENGVVHYSDAPTAAADTEMINVDDAYRPGTAGANPSSPYSDQSAAQGDDAAAVEPPPSYAQQRREQLASERQERREAQAEIDQMCTRHRQRLAQVEPARRVFYTNEEGESVRMDDDKRIGLVEESKEFIAKNCE